MASGKKAMYPGAGTRSSPGENVGLQRRRGSRGEASSRSDGGVTEVGAYSEENTGSLAP